MAYGWFSLVCVRVSLKQVVAVFQPHSGVAFKDNDKETSSQRVELWAIYLVMHFVAKEECSEVRTCTNS